MGLLDRLQVRKAVIAAEGDEPKVTFNRAKGDFITCAYVALSDVQVNVGFMTLDGKPEVKSYTVDKRTFNGTPIRLKVTAKGKAKGASLMSGKFPMAYHFARVVTELDLKALETALEATAGKIRELELNPVFDPGDTTE